MIDLLTGSLEVSEVQKKHSKFRSNSSVTQIQHPLQILNSGFPSAFDRVHLGCSSVSLQLCMLNQALLAFFRYQQLFLNHLLLCSSSDLLTITCSQVTFTFWAFRWCARVLLRSLLQQRKPEHSETISWPKKKPGRVLKKHSCSCRMSLCHSACRNDQNASTHFVNKHCDGLGIMLCLVLLLMAPESQSLMVHRWPFFHHIRWVSVDLEVLGGVLRYIHIKGAVCKNELNWFLSLTPNSS